MTNRLVTILLILATTGALLFEAGRSVMSPEDRWRQWLQLLAAQQIADTLDRQVELGPVTDLSLNGVEARDLALAEGRWLSEGVLATARRVRIDLDLMGIARGEVAPAAGIDRVELDGAWVHVVRDEAGELNLQKIMPEGPPVPPEERFRGVVHITDSAVMYDDLALPAGPGGAVNLELVGINADVDMRQMGWVEVVASARERLGRFGSIALEVQSEMETGFAWLDLRVSELDAAYWYGLFSPTRDVRIERGRADVSASIGVMPGADGESDVSLCAHATARDAALRLAALGGRRIVAEADATVTMDGVDVHRLSARSGGLKVEADGFVADFQSPVIDLAFDASAVSPEELMELAPDLSPEVQRRVEGVSVAGPVLVSGRLTGPVAEANLAAEVGVPGEVRYADADVGEILAGPVDLRVELLDLSRPSLRARAEVAQAEALDTRPIEAMLPGQMEGPLALAPLEDVQADVLWSDEVPLAQTRVHLPRVEVGSVTVEELQANLAMAQDVLRVSDLQARPMGAELSADAVVDLGGAEGPWVWASGEIDRFGLERLQDLPGLEAAEGAAGSVSAPFVVTYEAGRPLVVAQASVEGPKYQDYGVESLRGLVVADGDGVQVRGAVFEDPLGTGWLRGAIPYEGDVAASFGVGGVDLAAVAERYELEVGGLRGEAFVTGSAHGPIETATIEASVRGFGAGTQDYWADAVVAGLSAGADLSSVQVHELYASRGRIVARVAGELSGIDLEERDAEIEGTVTLAGPVDDRALDLAKIEREDLAGAVRAEIDLGGTIKRPSARGEVYLDYARYQTAASDGAILRVSLQGDVLELDEMRVPVGDAVVTGEASVTSLYDERMVSASVRAENVMLQDLAPWQEVGLPLSGRVDLPYLSLQGPLDDLKGMAQVQATDLQLGNEEIGEVEAWVVLDANALMLRRTTLALAGGTMALEGRMRLDERRIMPSRVEFDDVSIAELLRLGVPIAERLEELEEAAEDAEEPAGEAEEPGQPLWQQLQSLSMRCSGRMDGSVAVEGLIPELPEGEREPEDAVAAVLEAMSGEVDVAVRGAAFEGRALPDATLHAGTVEHSSLEGWIEATEGDALITASGSWEPHGDLDALAEVSALDLAILRPWLPAAVHSTGGRLNLTVQALGSITAPELMGSIDIIEPEAHGVRFDVISAPIIRYDGERLDISDLVIREGEEEIFVDGTIPFDWDTKRVPSGVGLEVVAKAEKTDLGIFPPLIADALGGGGDEPSPLAEVNATGTLDSLVKVTGTPDSPELNGQVRVNAPTIETPWLGSPVEDLVLDVSFTGLGGKTLVEVKELSARAESTTLEVGGRAEMSEYDMARLVMNDFDLTATVAAPQQSFGSDGLTARKLRGTVTLKTREPGEQLLTVEDLGADFGKGKVVVNGTVGLTSFLPEEFALNDFDLVIEADDARPRYGDLFLGKVDGKITMRNPAEGKPVAIEGGMEISHAILGIPRRGGEGEGELQGMSDRFPEPHIDVALAIGPDVRVKTTGMVAPLEPTDRAVWVKGTPQRPTVQGLVEVQEGEARMPGGALKIETAGVRFLVRPSLGMRGRQPPPVPLDMEGRVWATATRTIDSTVIDGRQVGPVEILLDVSGTLPNNIHVQASSTPPLAEEQIYALLGTAPFTGGGAAAIAGDLQDVMTEQFVTALGAAFRHYVFEPFQEQLKEMLGLSVLEVSFALDQPVAVRLGGYVIEDLLITYKTCVTGSSQEYDLGVSYTVQRQFELSYRTDETNDKRFFVEYVRSF